MTQGVGLFDWPEHSAVNRVVPKNKIYEHARPSASLRGLFVRQVDQIVWAYKLSPETVNLAARAGVPEIEAFQVNLKTQACDESVLRCIDRAIPYPIVFELRFGEHVKAVAAWKRPSESDSAQWVVGEYVGSDWQPAGVARSPLPVALDLGGLYEQLLHALVSTPVRSGESLGALMERHAQVRAAEAAARQLAARLGREKQFNRKVELNARLRTIRDRLEVLTR